MSNNIDFNLKFSAPERENWMISGIKNRFEKYAYVKIEELKKKAFIERKTGKVIILFDDCEPSLVAIAGVQHFVMILNDGLTKCLLKFDENGKIKLSPEFEEISVSDYMNYLYVKYKGENYFIDKNLELKSINEVGDVIVGDFHVLYLVGGEVRILRRCLRENGNGNYQSCYFENRENDCIIFSTKEGKYHFLNTKIKYCSEAFDEVKFLSNERSDILVANKDGKKIFLSTTGDEKLSFDKIILSNDKYALVEKDSEEVFVRFSDWAIAKFDFKI